MDDEVAFTRLLRLTLPDYDLREENDPTRAVLTALEWQPDLILLDVIMPGMDGGELAAKLRAEPSLGDVPIVFVTAIVSQKEAAERKLLGGFPFLTKPITPEALRQCIESYLPRANSALTGLSRGLINGAKRLAALFTGGPA